LLAAAGDFVHGWMFWVAAPILAVWVGMGGVLLRRGVKAHVSRSQGRLTRCLVVSLLAGLGSAVAAIIVLVMLATLGKEFHFNPIVPAAFAVPVVFIAIGFTVLYAAFELPALALLRISGVAFAIPLLVAAGGGGPASWYAYNDRQADLARQHSKTALEELYRVLTMNYRGIRPPKSLTTLVTQNIVPPDRLKCRRRSTRAVDYFYVSTDLPVAIDKPSQKILACDYIENQDGEGRTVLFINGLVRWYSRNDLPGLLALPENRDFAAALSQAEKSSPESPQGQAPPPPTTPPVKGK
jgi:hypothetical protein